MLQLLLSKLLFELLFVAIAVPEAGVSLYHVVLDDIRYRRGKSDRRIGALINYRCRLLILMRSELTISYISEIF